MVTKESSAARKATAEEEAVAEVAVMTAVANVAASAMAEYAMAVAMAAVVDEAESKESESEAAAADFHRQPAPVFTTPYPSRIEDISHEALVKWSSQRAEYEKAMNTRCARTGEDPARIMVSVNSTMDVDLLSTCCRLKWKTTVGAINDERLRWKLESIIKSVESGTLPDIDRLFEARLKIDLCESNVSARVINYFKLCDQIIKENGLTKVFEGESGMKEKCRVLAKSIGPNELRSAIKIRQRYQDQQSKACEVKLFDLIMELALEQDRLSNLTKRADQKMRKSGCNTLPGKGKKRKTTKATQREENNKDPQP